MTTRVGVKVGQRRERSGICAVEDEWRADGGQEVRHFVVRYLQQLEAGMPFPDVAARVGEVVANARSKGASVEVFIDATGFGMQILELVKENVGGAAVTPVYFSHGDRRVVEREEVQLGKAYLVAQLQMLIQTRRLHLLRTQAARPPAMTAPPPISAISSSPTSPAPPPTPGTRSSTSDASSSSSPTTPPSPWSTRPPVTNDQDAPEIAIRTTCEITAQGDLDGDGEPGTIAIDALNGNTGDIVRW